MVPRTSTRVPSWAVEDRIPPCVWAINFTCRNATYPVKGTHTHSLFHCLDFSDFCYIRRRCFFLIHHCALASLISKYRLPCIFQFSRVWPEKPHYFLGSLDNHYEWSQFGDINISFQLWCIFYKESRSISIFMLKGSQQGTVFRFALQWSKVMHIDNVGFFKI